MVVVSPWGRIGAVLQLPADNHAVARAGRLVVGWLVGAVAAVCLCAPAGAAEDVCQPPPPCALRPVSAQRIERSVAAGEPVFLSCVLIDSDLDVAVKSRAVTTPLVVRNSCITGAIRAHSTTFESIVDLSGTTIAGPVNFYSSEFDRVAAFDGTRFLHRATFAVAAFAGAATFYGADFARQVSFADASFARGANFSGAQFRSVADFADSNFGQESRFSLTEFYRGATFRSARFGDGADFTGTHFDAPVNFEQAAAQGTLAFHSAHFNGSDDVGADFSHVLFGGQADFSDAGHIAGPAVFDAANLASLDLNGATVDSLGTPERIEKLRIAPGALAAQPFVGSVEQREADYRMLEDAARNADDLPAANEAKVLRRSLERSGELPVERQLDYAFYWGVGGYFVRPWHPVAALVLLFLAGILVRGISNRHEREGLPGVVMGAGIDARGAWRAFRKEPGRPDADARRPAGVQIELALYAVLVLVLLVNLEGVSSPIRNLVEGLL
jgi:uncharacterized protein YjbI with pentapeptide repeats